jgi:hypothetical protein
MSAIHSRHFRRNHWVPVPQARDLEELDAQLREACPWDQQRQIAGREMRVGAAMLIERDHLLPLAEEAFELAEASYPTVDRREPAMATTVRRLWGGAASKIWTLFGL